MAEMAKTREQALYMAGLAEKFERYDEMFQFMEKVIQFTVRGQSQPQTLGEQSQTLGEVLTFDERNLFSVASKHVVRGRLEFLLSLSSIQRKELEQEQKNADTLRAIENYYMKVNNELLSFCTKVIGILDCHLIRPDSTAEYQVFYLKMKGDYYRYLAEMKVPTAANSAEEAYNRAKEIAEKDMDATHPIRLNLAINFSVFCYYILNHRDRAKKMAKEAYKAASVTVKNSGEEHYRDSLAIMQLLNHHILSWN